MMMKKENCCQRDRMTGAYERNQEERKKRTLQSSNRGIHEDIKAIRIHKYTIRIEVKK